MQIEGKKVLVTGGSRGLGRALGEVMAARGADVVLVARRAGPLEEVVHAMRARGQRAHALVMDVAQRDAAARIAGAAAAMVGAIDVVVHNASSLGPSPLRPLAETSDDDFDRAIGANLTGAFRLSRALVGPMIQRGHGVLVHVSSDAAVSAHPSWGAYGAAKAALDHLSRTWAVELEGTGVRSFSIDPGDMDTALHHEAIPDADRSALARPEDVATRVVLAIEREDLAPSGSRVTAAQIVVPS